MIDVLGEGGYATVLRGCWLGHVPVAVKLMGSTTDAVRHIHQQIVQELHKLRQQPLREDARNAEQGAEEQQGEQGTSGHLTFSSSILESLKILPAAALSETLLSSNLSHPHIART